MLQQTRVETAEPYFHRWMERFPTLSALASAGEQDVLKVWEGLGYYSRARNLRQAAKIILRDLDGKIPASRAGLEQLPGIGPYTAGAISSIAFGQDEAALDGNIRRVLARFFNVEIPARSKEGEKAFWELARQNLPPGRAGDYNQAMMDLGATLCLPKNPLCALCPLAGHCEAKKLGLEGQRPVMNPRAAIPHYTVTAAVIRQDGKALIARRPVGGLLGGLWEFPGGKQEPGEDLPGCMRREIKEELGVEISVGEKIGVFRHAYTHFRVTIHAFECTLLKDQTPCPLEADEILWAQPGDLDQFPMGKIDRRIARAIMA